MDKNIDCCWVDGSLETSDDDLLLPLFPFPLLFAFDPLLPLVCCCWDEGCCDGGGEELFRVVDVPVCWFDITEPLAFCCWKSEFWGDDDDEDEEDEDEEAIDDVPVVGCCVSGRDGGCDCDCCGGGCVGWPLMPLQLALLFGGASFVERFKDDDWDCCCCCRGGGGGGRGGGGGATTTLEVCWDSIIDAGPFWDCGDVLCWTEEICCWIGDFCWLSILGLWTGGSTGVIMPDMDDGGLCCCCGDVFWRERENKNITFIISNLLK